MQYSKHRSFDLLSKGLTLLKLSLALLNHYLQGEDWITLPNLFIEISEDKSKYWALATFQEHLTCMNVVIFSYK